MNPIFISQPCDQRAQSLIFARYGGGAMLYHLAAMWLGFVVFSLIFRNDDPAAHALHMRAEPA